MALAGKQIVGSKLRFIFMLWLKKDAPPSASDTEGWRNAPDRAAGRANSEPRSVAARRIVGAYCIRPLDAQGSAQINKKKVLLGY